MFTRLEVPSYCVTSIPSEPKDCRLYASDGSSRHFHKNLLTSISPELYKLIGSYDRSGSTGVLLPVICSNGLQALYELVYSGQTTIPLRKVKQICAQLKALKVVITRCDLTTTTHNLDEKDEGYSGGGGSGNSALNNNSNHDNKKNNGGNVKLGIKGGGGNININDDNNNDVENPDSVINLMEDSDGGCIDEEVDTEVDGEVDEDEEEGSEETKGMTQDTKDIIRITRYIRKILPRASTFQTSAESFECFICFKSLCNSAVWANHLMAQHFYQNFTCPTCGKKFNYFNVFNQHLYKFHGYRTHNPFKESPGRRKSPPKTELPLL